VEVDEVPVTINGKKVETAVKQIISGWEIRVSSTVANPECLKGYRRWVGYCKMGWQGGEGRMRCD
jgi:acetoacetyl-CoA synthetase